MRIVLAGANPVPEIWPWEAEAAATELAQYARERGLDRSRILPTMADWEVYPRVAAATGVQAQRDGVAQLEVDAGELLQLARRTIGAARDATRVLIDSGAIPAPPRDEDPPVVA